MCVGDKIQLYIATPLERNRTKQMQRWNAQECFGSNPVIFYSKKCDQNSVYVVKFS